MFEDLNDCYGRALQEELAEANRFEQELIEISNQEAERYYAEMERRNDSMAEFGMAPTC